MTPEEREDLQRSNLRIELLFGCVLTSALFLGACAWDIAIGKAPLRRTRREKKEDLVREILRS